MVDESFREPAWHNSQSDDPFAGWRGLPRRMRRMLGRCRALLRLSESMAVLNASQIGSHLDALEQVGAAIRGELAALRAQLAQSEQHQNAIQTELSQLRAQMGPDAFAGLQRELSAELAFGLYDVARHLIAGDGSALPAPSRPVYRPASAEVEAQVQRLANAQLEAKNSLIHLGTSTESRLEGLNTVASEARNAAIHANTNLEARLNTIEHDRLGSLYGQLHDLAAALLRLRARIEGRPTDDTRLREGGHRPAPRDVLDASLRRAQDEYPRIYPMWAERLEEMRKACLETRVGNVAHAGEAGSEAFRSLLEIHASGRTLDVGCGIFGRPYYLATYPPALLSGLDPLEPVEPPDFEFVRGIQEYLPWPDGAFSTVVSATSLDHCLSLDRSLAEIRRVLRPGGTFLLWIGSTPGARCYDPEAADFAPADRFHLFHFDAAWLEPMLARAFDTTERIRLRGLEFDHLMYCLRLRAT